jgi:predicted transcriptional regulator
MDQPKSVEEISKDSRIPLSTCYEKVTELLGRGMLKRERIIITREGKKHSLYRATIRAVYVEFGPAGLKLATVANKEETE